jgi:hypothetical protein
VNRPGNVLNPTRLALRMAPYPPVPESLDEVL